jgi:multidrug efflux pump subunit AcrB
MWIVRLALRRPYTFVVASILVFILGIVAIVSMPTDVFPVVDIPVIAVCYNYSGMSPQDMNARIITPFERILSTTVNDVAHIESQSLYGIGVVKIYFQPNANIYNSNAQVTAIGQTFIRQAPPGTQPPLIIEYNASNVPVVQLLVSSKTMPEQKLFDATFNFMRPQLISVPGVQMPYPYGGKQRQVIVDLNPDKMFAYGISPADVSNAINQQNLILPAGTSKIGKQEYEVVLNASVSAYDAALLNNLPIKTVNGIPIYVHDVANVRDGFIVQTNIVHSDGKRAVLQSVLKSGGASTLSVVDGVLAKLGAAQSAVSGPPGTLSVVPAVDQSVFVRASVEGVVKEAAIAAGLTALMILLFLGSWRSTLIVMASIPLSILVSLIILWSLGETLNVMTLGGMALAVGILVDDATVEIENIHRNLHQKKRLVQAILDGASQIAVPAFVSTLCICIVFVPVVFITGAAKYLFTPLAMAVVFAMMTSYLLSRTLVPTMVHYLLAAEVEMYGGVLDENDPHAVHARHAQEAHAHGQPVAVEDETLVDRLRRYLGYTSVRLGLVAAALLAGALFYVLGYTGVGKSMPMVQGFVAGIGNWFKANPLLAVEIGLIIAVVVVFCWLVVHLTRPINKVFNRLFERFRLFYGGVLAWALLSRAWVVIGFVILVVVSCCLLITPPASLTAEMPWLGALGIGRDFFPGVDAGQMRLHVRCPPGTRIEQTEQYFATVEDSIRKVIAPADIKVILDNMGIPNSSINLALSDGSIMSPADGEILISLTEGHRPTEEYQEELREKLPKEHPNLKFFFEPADIVTQVLNFGLQAPIDIQVATPKDADLPKIDAIAQGIMHDVNSQPGIVDVRMQQVPQTPDIRVNVDRTLASEAGVTQSSVASDLLISLSSSNQVAPNYWLGSNGVNYQIYVQTPQYKLDSVNQLENTPITPTNVVATPENVQLLGNLATITREVSPTNVTHYDLKTTRDILMNVDGTDLGTAAAEVQKIVDKWSKNKPLGSSIMVRGQVQSMHDSFTGLGEGLIFAVVLVYLLMVINFQSWMDPLIILMALPGALSGILWMLWATRTNISVPALMGSIMSIGVATSNSILMITFANDQRKEGADAHDAALAAGLTRLRPVVMTALAMIIGMLPMSLGLGEGGEQNAPLGRAVIGGLSMATFATLLFVPVMYSLLRKTAPQTHIEPELQE